LILWVVVVMLGEVLVMAGVVGAGWQEVVVLLGGFFGNGSRKSMKI